MSVSIQVVFWVCDVVLVSVAIQVGFCECHGCVVLGDHILLVNW